MRTKISIYWPLAVVVALVALASLRAFDSSVPREPLAAAQVSAELARAISYGLIDDGAAHVSPAVGHRTLAGTPQAS